MINSNDYDGVREGSYSRQQDHFPQDQRQSQTAYTASQYLQDGTHFSGSSSTSTGLSANRGMRQTPQNGPFASFSGGIMSGMGVPNTEFLVGQQGEMGAFIGDATHREVQQEMCNQDMLAQNNNSFWHGSASFHRSFQEPEEQAQDEYFRQQATLHRQSSHDQTYESLMHPMSGIQPTAVGMSLPFQQNGDVQWADNNREAMFSSTANAAQSTTEDALSTAVPRSMASSSSVFMPQQTQSQSSVKQMQESLSMHQRLLQQQGFIGLDHSRHGGLVSNQDQVFLRKQLSMSRQHGYLPSEQVRGEIFPANNPAVMPRRLSMSDRSVASLQQRRLALEQAILEEKGTNDISDSRFVSSLKTTAASYVGASLGTSLPPSIANDAMGKDMAMKRKKKGRYQLAKNFVEKLMEALVEAPNTSDDAFSWLPDGKSFVVVNSDLFVSQVLQPVFRRNIKYSSFVRKLHRWGFIRLTSGGATDCFHNPYFQRGRNDLLYEMTCTPVKEDSKGVNAASKGTQTA